MSAPTVRLSRSDRNDLKAQSGFLFLAVLTVLAILWGAYGLTAFLLGLALVTLTFVALVASFTLVEDTLNHRG